MGRRRWLAAAALAAALGAGMARAGDDGGFEELGPPKPGEWLHSFPERHQSAAQHRRTCSNRATEKRRRVCVLPLGRIATEREALISSLREYLAAFFGLEAEVLPPLAPPREAWSAKRRQWDGDRLLGWLETVVPDDAVACGAFIEEDLFSDDLNFVFGVASLEDRVGVYSVARLGERYRGAPAGATLERRTLGLATHELGHIFGIHHCTKYRCNMQGSNSLEESDRQPLHLCPIDLDKLSYATGVDPAKRYAALEGFYRARGMTAEADFCAARLAAMGRRKA
jgi:archaemetzincin